MKTYKMHLIITDKSGNFKRYACNKKGYQDGTHDASEVTCINCGGKANSGKVVEGYGFPFSDRLKIS